MKTTFISTAAINSATRLSRLNLQARLAEGQKEATTGRYADVGQSLGYLTGRSVSLRQELDRLNTFKDTNAVATSRLQITQTNLEGVQESAQAFLDTLIVARSTATGASVAVADAKAKLISLVGSMNMNVNGAFIFAGINSDVKPLEDYFGTPTPASKTAVDTAFVTEFGIPQTDPAIDAITGAQMQTFLDGAFATLFDTTSWTATWSAASDQNVRSRISNNELIQTATNANAEPIRDLASAFTMVADLGLQNLSEDAYQALIGEAIGVVGKAIGDLTQLRAALGTSEERIKSADERMTLQITVMANHVNLLEGVDPYEAATQVNALLTQIETAYALTARIQRLSLVNFL